MSPHTLRAIALCRVELRGYMVRPVWTILLDLVRYERRRRLEP